MFSFSTSPEATDTFSSVTRWTLLKVRRYTSSDSSQSKSLSEWTLFFYWLPLSGPCPHQRAPVETDESMTSSSLDLAWPPACKQCSCHSETSPQKHSYGQASGTAYNDNQWRHPGGQHQQDPRAASRGAPQPCSVTSSCPEQTNSLLPAGGWPHGLREQSLGDHSRGIAGPSDWPHGLSVQEALEPPYSLKSEINCTHNIPPQYPAACMNGQCDWNIMCLLFRHIISLYVFICIFLKSPTWCAKAFTVSVGKWKCFAFDNFLFFIV